MFRRSFNSRVLPFAPGRIYQCSYRSGRPGYIVHDPMPTVFVLSSDMYYTTGINAHYIGAMQYTLATWIISARNSNLPINGLVIYQLLKRNFPFITKMAFRKYFTRNLRGRLVSAGMSNVPEPNIIESIAEPWIRRINQTFKDTATRDKIMNSATARAVSAGARMTDYHPITSSPFKQRISYNPPGQQTPGGQPPQTP
jgi:hypothetical protein